MAKKLTLPQTIYVTQETDANDKDQTYLLAAESTEKMDHGSRVGIYELKETRTLKVNRELK